MVLHAELRRNHGNQACSSYRPLLTLSPPSSAPLRSLPSGKKREEAMDPGLLLLEAANWSTIAACLVLKLPQGAALVAARSARGVSLESLLLELGG